jgi:hypothetical protein
LSGSSSDRFAVFIVAGPRLIARLFSDHFAVYIVAGPDLV